MIYGVEVDNTMEWKITCNFDIDRKYWHNKGFDYLVLVNNSYSISEARYLIKSATLDTFASNIIKTIPGFEVYREDYDYISNLINTALEGKLLLMEEVIAFFNDVIIRDTLDIKNESIINFIQVKYLYGKVNIYAGIEQIMKNNGTNNYVCNRCGSSDEIYIKSINNKKNTYSICEKCINMGKSDTESPLIHFFVIDRYNKKPNSVLHNNYFDEKQLTPLQKKVAITALEHIKFNSEKEFVIWAVTGAGKTEMIYPVINYGLNNNYKILFASPRKDVIRELQPRIKKTFKDLTIVALYGGSNEKWNVGNLYLATTHQVLRFINYFDIVILDELDAFPYHNNSMLQFAVKRSVRTTGKIIYMTATPTKELQDKMKNGEVKAEILPLRYHGKPLPIPKVKLISKKGKILKNDKPNKPIKEFVNNVIDSSGQGLIFVPSIKDISIWVKTLRSWFPHYNIEGVYAKDNNRERKIDLFKGEKIDFLVTTTIMERGITIPNVHVLVIEADSIIFSTSTLIQIAGRVGRSELYQDGTVLFLCSSLNKDIISAIKFIKKMNKMAKKSIINF